MRGFGHFFKSIMAGESPINRPNPILHLLQEHKKKHTLVYLSFDDHPKKLYQSIIIDINKHNHQIHIDDIFPRDFKLSAGQSMTVSLRDAKHHWQNFQTSVIEDTQGKLLFGHLLTLPDYIVGEQRREAYRLHLEGDCYWNSEGYRQHHSNINDISATGVQLTLGRFYQDQLEPGQILSDCQLQIPGLDIDCDLSIARILDQAYIHQDMRAPVTDEEHITLGAKIIDMEGSDRRILEGYLMEEQRQRRQQSALLF